MNFIEEIVVKDFKGINELKVNSLARINVLCGKNNSGKSTILKAIKCSTYENYSKNIFLKISYSEQEEINEICDSILELELEIRDDVGGVLGRAKIGDSQEKELIDFIRKYFLQFQKENHEILYTNNMDEIYKKFKAFYEAKVDIENIINSNWQYLGQFFALENKFVIIDSNRELRSVLNWKDLNIEEHSGILDRLFYLKNQDSKSKENQRYQKLKAVFVEISEGCDFDLTLSTRHKKDFLVNLKFREKDNEWYDAYDCGQGLSELLIILTNIIVFDIKVVCIEEPENHLHPNIQRKLFSFIKNHSKKQFFISTHSNIFLDNTFTDKIYHVKNEKEGITLSDDTSKAQILQDLGYSVSDNLLADLILLVEGPSDKPVFEELFNKIGIYEKYNLKIWALGGDTMDKHDLSIFKDTYNVYAIIDKDPGSNKIRNRFIKNCEELGIIVTRLKRYSIENYFSIAAIKKVFKGEVPNSFKRIDPDKKLIEQLGFSVKKKNRAIVKEMDINDIKGTDLYDFIIMIKNSI